MLISEQLLENSLKIFFKKAKIPRPGNFTVEDDREFMVRCVLAFIAALEEIEKIDYCYGFDETKVFEKERKSENRKGTR